MTTQDNSDKPKKASEPFIPAAMDDAGLTPTQFRVLAHLLRRGVCYSSAETIAEKCRINRDTVFAAIKVLVLGKFVLRDSRPGRTTQYKAAPMLSWQPVGKEGTGNPSESRGRGVTEKRGHHPSESEGRHPSEKRGHEGSPSEGSPTEGNPNKEKLSSVSNLPAAMRKGWMEA